LAQQGNVAQDVHGGWQINAVKTIRKAVVVAMPGSVKLIGDPVLANPTNAR
jgi:hypothetical protein